jgi:hypothetical protein
VGEPSIKGAAVAPVAQYVAHLVKSGKVGEQQLEASLDEKARAVIAGGVQAALWYPIGLFDSLMELSLEADASASEEAYLRLNGQMLAASLREMGTYSQLESRSTGPLELRDVRRTLTLWNGVVNFSTWNCSASQDEGRAFDLNVDDAAAFSPGLRVANAGFLEGVFGHLTQVPVRSQYSSALKSFSYSALRSMSILG